MAEEIIAPTTAAEASPMAEETPIKKVAAPKEEEAAEEANEIEAETKEIAPLASVHKRKLEDHEGDEEENKKHEPDLESCRKKDEIQEKVDGGDGLADAKRHRVDGDGEGFDGSHDVQKEAQPMGNGQFPHSENIDAGTVDTVQNSAEDISQQGALPAAVEQDTAQNSMQDVPQQSTLPSVGQHDTSRKIEVPNNKVGVLIGKAGETIRLLQNSSGAKIQITKDAEANPNLSTRPVELTGTLENINKAEQLIKDVIAEADTGGSPALIARIFSATQSGSEVHEMQVPNEKVGWIIGKGGETIKMLQTSSHARIQLIPQHLPEGDFSKERTVRITGNKKQIEVAKIMIKDVMNQQPARQLNPSSGQTQGHRPRSTQSHRGPRGAPSQFQSQMPPNTGYDYPQRGGSYQQPQNTQYPQQPYGGGYPQQPPQRSAAAPVPTPHGGGYDYYGQGGQAMGAQPSSYPSSAPTSAHVNYNNYGQTQPAAGYGHQPNPYSQSAPPQQSYGGFDNQVPDGQQQQQQPGGYYSQQGGSAAASGYAQQPPPSYGGKPAAEVYAGAPPAQSAYGPPANQGPVPSSYGTSGPAAQQQTYPPYGSLPGPTSQPVAYSQGYGPASTEGYNNQPPPSTATVAAGGYSQPPNYGQGYNAQPGGAGGYGQYPPPAAQPPAAAYGDQSAPPASNVNYGYHQGGASGGGYGGSVAPSSGAYGAPAYGTQPSYGGYGQPPTAAANYDQLAAGYGSAPPVGYAKGVSPQPPGAAPYGGGGGQYDSAPPSVYGGQR